jgi:hypothetical protein
MARLHRHPIQTLLKEIITTQEHKPRQESINPLQVISQPRTVNNHTLSKIHLKPQLQQVSRLHREAISRMISPKQNNLLLKMD